MDGPIGKTVKCRIGEMSHYNSYSTAIGPKGLFINFSGGREGVAEYRGGGHRFLMNAYGGDHSLFRQSIGGGHEFFRQSESENQQI